jgi:hypothetical protein
MSAENYQFRDYPRPLAERAWRRIAGHPGWIRLDRFAVILAGADNDEGRSVAVAAVSSKAFLGKSGRRLALFLPKPSQYERRCDVWRVTAKILQRFMTDPDLGHWYSESIWVPVAAARSWCAEKGFKFEPPVHPPEGQHNANTNRSATAPGGPEKQVQESYHLPSSSTPKHLRGKSGPKPKYKWEKIKAEVFAVMDKRGEFNSEKGWYRAALIRLILDKFPEDDQGRKQIDERGLDRHLKDWLTHWRILRAARPRLKQVR